MKRKILIPAVVIVSTASSFSAPVLPGAKIGIDYGPTATTNWNNFSGNGNKAVGTVLLLDGNVADMLAMTVSNGQFFNNDGTNNWVGLQSNPTSIAPNPKAPAEFVDSVTTDIAGNFSLGDANPFRLVVTGLNPYLAYKIDAVSSAASGSNTESMTVIGASSYGPTAISRPLTVTQGLYHSFASVLPTTAGELTFQSIDSGAGTNPILNGILIETLAPTAAGLLDNDSDTMPNWWEVAYQFNPASGADATTDFDSDGISNAAEFVGGSDPRDPLSTPPILWTFDGNGNWNTGSNWSSGNAPNGQDRIVRLPASALVTAADATIALDTAVTVGRLEVLGGKSFTLGAGNPLTLSTSGPKAFLNTSNDAGSSLKMLGNVVLSSHLEVATPNTSSITVSGNLSESAALYDITKNGTGDLVLSGDTSAFTGGLLLNAGRIVLNRTGDFSFDNNLSGAGSFVHAGGGILTQSAINSHSGGTLITNGGTLTLDNAGPLGSGAIALDNATLHAMGNIGAGTKALNVGTGGASIRVDDTFTLTSGASLPTIGTVNKVGLGTWRIQGGNTGTMGLFTVSEGTVDLNRNDAFGNHTGSQQDLAIAQGATVTNGTDATGFTTFRNLTLSGGTLSVTNSLSALSGKFQAYSIKQSIIVTGSAPSVINDLVAGINGAISIGGTTDIGTGRGSDLLIDVADVTSNTNTDLTISAKLKNSIGPANGYAILATGIVKEGPGTLLLSGQNSYTGDTTVNEGTVILTQSLLADNADVSIDAGASLKLDFVDSDTIDQLHLGGITQQPGIYGAIGSGAEFETARITGTGTLTVNAGPDLSAFELWILNNYPTLSAPDNEPDKDPDHDGASNFEEFAFSGNPTDSADRGARRVAIDEISGSNHLTLTLAIRTGATFTGSGPLTANLDGVDYAIRGSNNLQQFTTAVSEVSAITTGLPPIASGYTYRSFRITDPVTSSPKAFLQATATEVTP